MEKVTVLLVDDEKDYLDSMYQLLQESSLRVRTAASVGGALNLIENGFHPEGALIDWLLPPGDVELPYDNSQNFTGGLIVAAVLGEVTHHSCRTIVQSGLTSDPELMRKMQNANVWGYVERPPNIEALDSMISALQRGILVEDEKNKVPKKLG